MSRFLQKRLAKKLLRHTRQVGTASQFPVIEIDSNQQKGDTFAERYLNAVQKVFNQGYDTVISIGSDCPTLDQSDIRDAANQLKHSDAVMGCSQDGGAYLLGWNKDSFERRVLAALPWQTSDMANVFLQSFSACGLKVHILDEAKSDIDHTSQIEFAFRTNDSLRLTTFINTILSALSIQVFDYKITRLSDPVFAYRPLRAPPFSV